MAGPLRLRARRLAGRAQPGGALGNGVDRFVRLAPGGGTGVVDFIKVNYPWGGSWPTFNIADALLAIGIGALLLPSLVRRKPNDAAPQSS